MSEIHSTRMKKVLAGGAALALGLMGAVTLSAPASAANGNIDPNETGSLTIHKHESPNSGTSNNPGDGTIVPEGDPIAGVEFDVCLIQGGDFNNVLSTNNTFWDAVKALDPTAALPSGVTLDCSYGPVTTDANGIAVTSTALPLGAYLVTETDGPDNILTPAQPFVVTIPSPEDHTNLDGGWVYDVHVYPKNSVVEGPKKDIVDQEGNGVVLGEPITYNVTTKLPALEDPINKFIISDTLDSKLDPNTDLSTLVVTPFGGPAFVGGGTDYTAVWSGQKLTVTFTAAGLAKLNALPSGTNIVLTFEAAANAIGEIDNQAFVNINDLELGTEPNTPGEGSPTNVVTTRWGGAQFVKVDQATQTTTLGGAQFEVYMSMSESGCLATPLADLQKATNADGSAYTVTSQPDGTVTIPGLWVGDTELEIDAEGNITDVNEANHDFDERCYVLVETVAPAGYILPADPNNRTEFIVTTGQTVQLGGLATITNKQQGVPSLPLTGGSGQILMVAGGGVVLAIAITAAVIARRRKDVTAQ